MANERILHLQVLLCSCLIAAVLIDGQSDPGATGATGMSGIQGNSGPVGFPGSRGPVGPIGSSGKTGATGRPGVPGGSGGATGATGQRGNPGPAGPMGNVGARGPAGPPGVGGSQTDVNSVASQPQTMIRQSNGNTDGFRTMWAFVGICCVLVVLVLVLLFWNSKMSTRISDLNEKYNLMKQRMDSADNYEKVAYKTV